MSATIAFDRSARRKDDDGRLHVAWTNISKATVNPYYGREIPAFDTLVDPVTKQIGLDPNRVYQMLRDPSELERAAPTFNNLPLLSVHKAVSASNPEENLVAGSTGTDAEFRAPYLGNSLVVWRQEDINAIESGERRELSCAYYYDADMTPGEYQGLRYDGVMRNLRGNHVALVPQGRAGPDVMVHDAASEEHMAVEPLTSRKALMVRGAVAAFVGPLLKSGSRLAYDAILADVTRETWPTQKPKIVDTIVARATPILAADAKLDPDALKLALDKADEDEDRAEDDDLEAMDADMDDEEREEEKKARAEDRGKGMSAKDRKKAMDARKAARDAKRAKDAKKAKDEKEDDEDEERKADAEDKGKAMDAAIAAAEQRAEERAVARMTAVAQAREDVRPIIGAVDLAMDSAATIYKAALNHLKVDLTGVPESAYGAVLKAIPKHAPKPVPAMDAATASASLHTKFPGLARIGMA